MLDSTKVVGIIAAGGTGSRLGISGGKQLAPIAGKPTVAWATQAICDIPDVDEIIVVCDPNRIEEFLEEVLPHISCVKPLLFVPGGDTRTQSVLNGLGAIEGSEDDKSNIVVLIHDGARPLATSQMMKAALQTFVMSEDADGVVVGHASSDTLKRVEHMRIIDTPQRSDYWMVQTPQIFPLDTLLAAYEYAQERGIHATDDSSLVEAAGYTVIMHEGPRDNIKVTRPEDLAVVEAALMARRS